MTIYQWDTHTSYNIDNAQQCNELIQKLERDPEKLIEFYQFICDLQNRLYEVKPELLISIANRIKILDDSGKLNGKQIKKIIEINAYIHPHIANESFKSNISSFFQAKLNAQNVFECLRSAKQNNNELFFRECLKFIEVNGSYITEITLNPMDEVNLKLLLNQCPNVEILNIQGNNNITLESLEGLDNLHKLKKLQLWSCKNLQGLPPLPESLESLFLRSCPKIQVLTNLPNHLQSLRLQMCNNIHTLTNLPDSLTTLDLSICPKLQCHSNLPGGLWDVTIQALPENPVEFLQKCLAKTLEDNLEKGLAVCKSCQYIESKDIEKVLASKLHAAIANKQNDIVEKIVCNVLNIQSERPEGLFEISIVDKSVHIDIHHLNIKPEEIEKIRKYLSEIYISKEVAIKFPKETVNQLNINIKEFLLKTSDGDEVSKTRLSSLINEWDTLINLCYEYKDWDTLRVLQASFQNILNLYGDKLRGVISTLNEDDAKILLDKLDTIYEKLDNKYLDANRLLKGSFEDKPISPAHFQWHLSQAILQEKAESLDPIQRKQLYLVMLQAYRKAAGFTEAESLNAQTTPLFPQQKGYYRHDEWEVTKKCTAAYAKKMGFTEKMYLVNNPLFKQVMLREFYDPGLGTDIKTLKGFDDFFNNLLGYMQSENSYEHDNLFLVDISKLMENQKITPANIQTLLNSLQDAYRIKFGRNMDWASKIQLMAFVKHEGQDILLLPKLFGQDNTQAMTSIETVLNHSGYRPSPSQIIEAWIKVEDPKNILQQENIPLATLATGNPHRIPTVCKNCAELAQTVIVKQFEDLSTTVNAPPYLKVLAKSTANMVKGLVNCNIDESFKEKGMQDLLQTSYFKILNAMHEAIHRQSNYIEFANQIAVIHGEIQSILTLIAPYKENDLEQAVIDNLTQDPSILPSDLERPKVHLFASGMHSLASVLAALEAQKGHNGINTLVLYDTYFESTKIVRGAKNYSINVIRPNEVGEGYVQYISGSRGKQPNDLYLCEFHHNICFGRGHYYPENVLMQVKNLRQKGKLTNPCTVVIDTTINLEHADNIRQFLADDEIKKAIKDGELNIVLLRSAQKFDMLGQDNYYGGITTTINNSEKFASFNARMNHPQDQLKDSNYQGLTHLQKYGDLDAYRRAIRENTEKLYNNLISSKIGMGMSMVVSKMEKNNLYFLDIKFRYKATAEAFKYSFLRFAKERNLPLTTRSSFGFANTNLSTIDDKVFRLNPGLEDENTFAQYALFFKKVQEAINQIMSKAMASKETQYWVNHESEIAYAINQIDIPQEPNFDMSNDMQIDEALSEAYTPAEEQKIQSSISVTGKRIRPSNAEEDEDGNLHKVKKQKKSSFSDIKQKKRKQREEDKNDNLSGNETLPPPKKLKHKQ